jgi:hypothetical protein
MTRLSDAWKGFLGFAATLVWLWGVSAITAEKPERGRIIWAVGLTPVALFALGVARKRNQAAHRALHGLCKNCGHDLRACKDRCAECGTPTST